VQSAGKNDDYGAFADCDALLVLAGDPAPEDEPIKKGVAFQVRQPFCEACVAAWLTFVDDSNGCSALNSPRHSSSSRRTRSIFYARLRKVH
jgi:hypothetical protein